MAIQISGTNVIDNSRNVNAGIGTFTSLNVPPLVNTFSPADGETGVAVASNIVITFNQPIQKGTGNITLRSVSAAGTILETIAVSAGTVTISASQVTINPVSLLPNNTDVYVVVDEGAFTNISFNSPTSLINTYNFTTINLFVSSFTPTNGATAVGVSTNITLAFNSVPTRGTGTITLRSGSTGGTIQESFDAASSGRISISGNNWILDPTSNLTNETLTFLVIPNQGIVNYVGLNTTGADTYSFTTAAPALGSSYEGGTLICKSSPVRWIVSPSSSQVTRTWYLRDDANTRAQQVSSCTGWFVPSCGQMQNPGFTCRAYWDTYNATLYWTNTELSPGNTGAWSVSMDNGNACSHFNVSPKSSSKPIRAFRCVTY